MILGYRIINPLPVSPDSDNCRRIIKDAYGYQEFSFFIEKVQDSYEELNRFAVV
jgi:hypothetical protein